MLTRDVLELAGRQHGVVSAAQLAERFDISRASIALARRKGLLVDMAPGVVRIPSSPDSFESRCVAACLRGGRAAFLSGWTAGRLYGLRRMPAAPIHLTMPGHARRDFPNWCDLHRSSWFADDQFVVRPDGMHVATPLRTLFGLAAAFNQFRFERAAEDAWHLRLVTPIEANDYLERHRCRGKDGVRRMEQWLVHALSQGRPSQSGLEQSLLDAISSAGLPQPVRQHPLVLPGGDTIHLDIAWPPVRLAVEPGASWWHGGDLAARRDQMRDRACAELDWLVLRFDETVLADVADAARQIARVHRRRVLEVARIR